MPSILLKILEAVMELVKPQNSLAAATVEARIREMLTNLPKDSFVEVTMELADGTELPVVFDVSSIPDTRRTYYRQLLAAGNVKPVGFLPVFPVKPVKPVKFHTCATCGKDFDPRDLNQVVAHQHKQIMHTAMCLPPGEQVGPCEQCRWSGKCRVWLGVSYDPKGMCDWSPSRFQEIHERINDGQGQGQAAQAGEAGKAGADNGGSADPDVEVP